MFIIRPHGQWNVRICKYRRLAIGLWSDRCALDPLVVTEADVNRRVTWSFQQLCPRMFIQHSLAERAKLLPFIAAILRQIELAQAIGYLNLLTIKRLSRIATGKLP